MSVTHDVLVAYETLCSRVIDVAAATKRLTLIEGIGRLVWRLGLPLLAIVGLQYATGLPFWLRAPVIPLLAIGLCSWGWRYLLRPSLERYSLTRAALLVESKRPELKTRLVSAIELYGDLQAPAPKFNRNLVEALVLHAHHSTAKDDFGMVIDRKPAKRQAGWAMATLLLWVVLMALDPAGMVRSVASLGTAWGDMRDVLRKATGARIVVEGLDRPAYLVGTDVTVRAREEGFHADGLTAMTREQGGISWKTVAMQVEADGRVTLKLEKVAKSTEVYFAVGRIESAPVTVVVTERPRITNLTVEYELPEYVRRAPIVQARSDGNLKALFGTTVTVTLEANKDLKKVELAGAFLKEPLAFSVAGRYAKGVIRLEGDRWMKDVGPEIKEIYKLAMSDEYGYANADAQHAYELVVMKDQSPKVQLVGLPHRSSADEPHVLEANLGAIPVIVKAGDDYGVAKVTVRYRIEDLETGAVKKQDKKELQFSLPRADIPQLSMLQLNEIGATVGDRVVFMAEVEDAYNLEPVKDGMGGPHRAATPWYKVAVVTQEEMFSEAVYKDDWLTQWYEGLQVATLSHREVPARTSPETEPAAKVAVKLMEASQVGDGVKAGDQQLIQDYFDSLNVVRTEK